MIGIDIIEISRFREMKNLEMFIRRVFTQNEADYFVSKGSAAKGFYESIAGHFAAKEAFQKLWEAASGIFAVRYRGLPRRAWKAVY